MTAKGILLVMMEPPASIEEEFNAWYDREHIPERLAVKGFETARRYVCVEGSPRYLALYDLSGPDVLHGPAYRRVSGASDSAWTKTVLQRVRVQRYAGVQRHPGDAQASDAARLLLLRFAGATAADEPAILAGLDANFAGRAHIAQYRLFACEAASGEARLAVVEARLPLDGHGLDADSFGESLGKLDLVNAYVRHVNP